MKSLKKLIQGLIWVAIMPLFRVFFRSITIRWAEEIEQQDGPWLIAANHPSTFLDALVIAAALYPRISLSFLARGGVGKGPFAGLLKMLGIRPIFRPRDGKNFARLNKGAFEEFVNLLGQGESLIIFVEGQNSEPGTLYPLRKGLARIARAYQLQFPDRNLRVLPVGLNYEAAKGSGERLIISFGHTINPNSLFDPQQESEGHYLIHLTRQVRQGLEDCLWQAPDGPWREVNHRLCWQWVPWFSREVALSRFAAGRAIMISLYKLANRQGGEWERLVEGEKKWREGLAAKGMQATPFLGALNRPRSAIRNLLNLLFLAVFVLFELILHILPSRMVHRVSQDFFPRKTHFSQAIQFIISLFIFPLWDLSLTAWAVQMSGKEILWSLAPILWVSWVAARVARDRLAIAWHRLRMNLWRRKRPLEYTLAVQEAAAIRSALQSLLPKKESNSNRKFYQTSS